MPKVEISRANPTCFLFLIDRSTSMGDPFGCQPGKKKSDGVADAINRLLQNLILRCGRPEGVRDFFHVGVLGYGSKVEAGLGGVLVGQNLAPISEVEKNPLRLEKRAKMVPDGAGGLVEETNTFPVWFDPAANGNTPMCQALEIGCQILDNFLARYPNCHPPIVINITDGEANDGDPELPAAAIRAKASTNGNVLLFNSHISSRPDRAIEFPDQEAGLPDEYARLLFRMSSPLPPDLQATARSEGFAVTERSRGFVFNGDLVSVIRFLDVGTRVDLRNVG
jgi:hypothetical protein